MHNTGDEALQGLRALISGSASFSLLSSSCGSVASPVTLSPSGVCNGVIRFSPSALGNYSGTVAIDSTNAVNGVQSASFSGTGGSSISSTSVSSVDFGTFSSSSSRSFTLTNTGNMTAYGSYVSVPAVAGLSVSSSNCGTSTTPVNLTAGSSCTVSLLLQNQSINSSVSIAGFTSGVYSLPLTGTYDPPASLGAISLSPSEVTFPLTEVGHTSDVGFTVSNTGSSTLTDLRALLSVTGPISLLTNNCGITGNTVSLASGSSCSGQLRFAPSTVEDASGTLAIDASNSANGVQSANITAPAGSSNLLTSPNSFDFGNSTGETVSRTVLIGNSGNMPVTALYATIPTVSGLSTVSNTCGTSGSPVSLAVGSTCSIALSYTGSGLSDASVSSNVVLSGATAGTTSVPVTGTYTAPTTGQISLSPTTMAFPLTEVNHTNTIGYTVTNTGPITLNGLKAVLATTGTGVSLTANTCGTNATPVTLAPGASCSGTVQYAPASVSSASGTLTVSATNSANGSQVANITAQSGSSIISGSAASFDFGVTYDAPTSRTIVFTNTGTMAASNVYATIPALTNVTTNSNSCGTSGSPVSLAPNGTCSITLTYSASTTSSVSGTVTLTGATAGALSVPVTGSNMAYAKLMTTPTNAGVTLTSNSVVTSQSSVYNMVLLNRPISSGKHYVEIQDMSYRDFVGITNLTANQYSTATTPSSSNYYMDTKASAVAMYMTNVNSSKLAYISSSAGSAVTPVSSTTISEAAPATPRVWGIAIDADTNKITWYNEAGDVLGQANVTMAKPWYFAVARGNSNGQGTLNFNLRNSTVLTGRAPSGFTSGIFEQ